MIALSMIFSENRFTFFRIMLRAPQIGRTAVSGNSGKSPKALRLFRGLLCSLF
jgi:hypothetical protein